jgi:LuxR family maltose regulon positive regulatory protein
MADEAYQEASILSQSSGDYVDALYALSMRGEVLQAQGQLRSSAQQYEQVLLQATAWDIPYAPVTGYALVGLGRVWCEWNDLETATRYAREGIQRGLPSGALDVLLRGYLVLARVRRAEGDLNGALEALRDAEPIVQRMGLSQVQGWLDALRAQVNLAQGDVSSATRWALGHTGEFHDEVYPAIPIALARVYLHLGQPAEAIAFLTHALQMAEAVGRLGNAMQIQVVLALAYQAQGNPDRALSALERALSIAAPEGYLRTFLDEGDAVVHLLRRGAARRHTSAYARHLLAALGDSARTTPPEPALSPVALVEPLTVREREILALIVGGSTNQEIADELVLAVNTVKKHTSNIFGKLGARNRTHAIAVARQMQLL